VFAKISRFLACPAGKRYLCYHGLLPVFKSVLFHKTVVYNIICLLDFIFIFGFTLLSNWTDQWEGDCHFMHKISKKKEGEIVSC